MTSEGKGFQLKDGEDKKPRASSKKSSYDGAREGATGSGRPGGNVRDSIDRISGGTHVFGFSPPPTDQPRASSSKISEETSQPTDQPGLPKNRPYSGLERANLETNPNRQHSDPNTPPTGIESNKSSRGLHRSPSLRGILKVPKISEETSQPTDQPRASSSKIPKETSQPTPIPERTKRPTTEYLDYINGLWQKIYSPIKSAYKHSLSLRDVNDSNNTLLIDSHLTEEPEQVGSGEPLEQSDSHLQHTNETKKQVSINKLDNERPFLKRAAIRPKYELISEDAKNAAIELEETFYNEGEGGVLNALDINMLKRVEALKKLHEEMKPFIRGDEREKILNLMQANLDVFTDDYSFEKDIEGKREIYRELGFFTAHAQNLFNDIIDEVTRPKYEIISQDVKKTATELEEMFYNEGEGGVLNALDLNMLKKVEAFKKLHGEMDTFIRGDEREKILNLMQANLDMFTDDYNSKEDIEGKREIYRELGFFTAHAQNLFNEIKEARSGSCSDLRS